MRLVVAVGCVGVTLVSLTGCRLAEPVGEWEGVVCPAVLAKASLEYYWRYAVQLKPDETIQRIWRLDENLYALTSGNRLLVLDAARGLYKWSFPVAEPGVDVFAPCHADDAAVPKSGGIAAILDPPRPSELRRFDAVIINTVTYALLLDRDSGELVRKLDFDFAANTPGTCDGMYFYVASIDGRIHAVRLSEGLDEWVRSGGGMVTARPVVFRGRLYAAGQDGGFRAFSVLGGRAKRLWTNQMDRPLTAEFVVDERGCFVPGQDHCLYALHNLTGEELWTFRTRRPLRSPVQVGRRTAFQYVEGDRFYAINLANGRKRWDLPDGRMVLGADGNSVFVLTADRNLLVVDETLGRATVSVPMTGLELFVANAEKPVIYAAARDGRFVCIRPRGSGHLSPAALKGESPTSAPAR